jgi:hypothetical protein
MSNARAAAAAKRRSGQTPFSLAPVQSFFAAGLSRMAEDNRRALGLRPASAAAATEPSRQSSPGGARWQDAMFGGRAATVQPSQSGNRWQDTMFGGRAAAVQPPVGGSWSPAAQQSPRLPAGRNVAIVNPRRQAENRALDQAAQNAGLPAWNWKAEENAAILKAAEERGQGAMAAREAQGGRGYITADNLPGTLDQGQAGYWQQADMQAWMNASEGNRKLAERAMARAGYDPQAATLQGLTAAAAQAPASGPGAMNGSEWSLTNSPSGPNAALAAAAAAAPNYDLSGMNGPDFAAPAPAPAQAFQGPLPTPDQSFPLTTGSVVPGVERVIDDPAQAQLQGYLQRIKNLNPTEWNFSRRAG